MDVVAGYRVLFVDAGRRGHWVEEFPLEEVLGPVSLGVRLHLERYKSWSKPAYHGDNALVMGAGLLAGTALYGVHRFVAVFKSPLTRGLHVAAMGGAAYKWNVAADALVVQGRSQVPLAIVIEGKGSGEISVEFHEIPEAELEDVWRGYKGLRGVYALQEYLFDRLPRPFEELGARSVLVGPASKYTSMGALFSIDTFKKSMDWGSEDLAARGGPGSVLYRAHGVAAVVYGGMYRRSASRPAQLSNMRGVDEYSRKVLGKPYITAVIDAGSKYRYDPKVGSGGTFGGNYPHLGKQTPMFNWNMIYLPEEVRARLHGMIMKHMWEPFNKEAIETKSWKTCGEPCPLACKKVRRGRYKTDYEPYNGLGPIVGVLDLHEAERLVELADSYGFDAIELGNVVGFVFEAISRGLLEPSEVGLSGRPRFDPASYSEEDAKLNADLAVEVIESLAWGRNPILRLIAEEGLRAACKVLDVIYAERVAKSGAKFEDLAIYASFGERGHITPNFYWTPGMVAPLPVLGRYWTLYSGVFAEPEEFAAKSYERAIRELMVDDSGVCRFHRGWAEKLLPEVHRDFHGVKDVEGFYRRVYASIVEYQERALASPSPWDSGKVVDFMASAAREYTHRAWAEKFAKDRGAAAQEWWERFYAKLRELALS
ncbi:MAG: aldehyde ferredoxin oxidoreductase N-terminal domain-containing protein [Desulfurococcaceae archaeon]